MAYSRAIMACFPALLEIERGGIGRQRTTVVDDLFLCIDRGIDLEIARGCFQS